MSGARFVVGIDLGTTNSAAAYVDSREAGTPVRFLEIPQLVAPAEIESRTSLPSFHYEPAPGECPPDSLRLPWAQGEPAPDYAVGVWAREHGAVVPGRLIVSAKSWLCHSGVDRSADLLPWHGAPEARKLSPGEVSARFLGHIRAAWNHRWPEFPLETQEVTITIPASFDEVARELTVAAARRAGLPKIVLLEEPQAAFYAWSHAHADSREQALQPGQKILVCDIGGGTSDFTLIEVRPGEDGRPGFHRFAVGDHLILGGDNLDLALAHFVEARLQRKLEPRQWSVLVRRCQQAKELLLGEGGPERHTISVPAGGSRLIGGALQLEITREEVTALLVDGFLPHVALEENPLKRSSGFQEFGLPFAPDPAITRYLAAFLRTHLPRQSPRPDVILLNGGLFQSPVMRRRLLEVVSSWFSSLAQPLVLENQQLDLAVAAGAAHYGMVRRGAGTRISGGLARTYYIGVQRGQEELALCLLPAGLEEGREIHLQEQEFQLLVRQPAEFPLYVSNTRTNDQPGSIVTVTPQELTALPPIRTALRAKTQDSEAVKVHLHARLTEIGTLEVWCSERGGPGKWRLQFDVRGTADAALPGGSRTPLVIEEPVVEACLALLLETFDPSHASGAETNQSARGQAHSKVESLVKRLEQTSGLGRFEWPPSLLRRLWELLLSLEPGRHQSPTHEARWFNLLGFCLRPGYGFAVDDWRVAQTWRLAVASPKVAFPRNELCAAEWWILWRRIAGGLSAGQQKTLADPLLALLRKNAGRDQLPWGSHESAEIWRMLAAFEMLSIEAKITVGDFLVERLQRTTALQKALLWSVGRLGARVPLHGPLNTVLPPERIEPWLEVLLTINAPGEDRIFALTQLARRTADRYRDISEALRARVLEKLAGAPARAQILVAEGGSLVQEEQELAFGEGLPKGLLLSNA